MDSSAKLGVVAGLMVLLLILGSAETPETSSPVPIAQEVQAELEGDTPRVSVTSARSSHRLSLEMLEPVYSEKAAFSDGLIRIRFRVTEGELGIPTALYFTLSNESDGVILLHWQKSSMELPFGDISQVLHKGQTYNDRSDYLSTTAIPPGSDLHDVIVPIDSLSWEPSHCPEPPYAAVLDTRKDLTLSDCGWRVSSGVLSRARFGLVLALETAGVCVEPALKYYTFEFALRPI